MSVGIAYAFFNCSAAKAAIEAELADIRVMAQLPGPLELTLIEGVSTLRGDAALMEIVRQALNAGIRDYVIEGRYHGQTNRETAEELGAILDLAYKSRLYKPNEPFHSGIVCREGDSFLFLE